MAGRCYYSRSHTYVRTAQAHRLAIVGICHRSTYCTTQIKPDQHGSTHIDSHRSISTEKLNYYAIENMCILPVVLESWIYTKVVEIPTRHMSHVTHHTSHVSWCMVMCHGHVSWTCVIQSYSTVQWRFQCW